MLRVHPHFHEGAFLKKLVHPLSRAEQSFFMTGRQFVFSASGHGDLPAGLEFFE
jgi:hypothetical protein